MMVETSELMLGRGLVMLTVTAIGMLMIKLLDK